MVFPVPIVLIEFLRLVGVRVCLCVNTEWVSGLLEKLLRSFLWFGQVLAAVATAGWLAVLVFLFLILALPLKWLVRLAAAASQPLAYIGAVGQSLSLSLSLLVCICVCEKQTRTHTHRERDISTSDGILIDRQTDKRIQQENTELWTNLISLSFYLHLSKWISVFIFLNDVTDGHLHQHNHHSQTNKDV